MSFDVVSLFTSIPIQFALDITKRKQYENNGWKKHTNLQEMQIVKLLKFVLNNSYFKFNGSHYHQVSGCAMGSPVKPGSHMSPMIGESLSVTIQGENSQRILLMSSHEQWSSPMSTTYEDQA